MELRIERIIPFVLLLTIYVGFVRYPPTHKHRASQRGVLFGFFSSETEGGESTGRIHYGIFRQIMETGKL